MNSSVLTCRLRGRLVGSWLAKYPNDLLGSVSFPSCSVTGHPVLGPGPFESVSGGQNFLPHGGYQPRSRSQSKVDSVDTANGATAVQINHAIGDRSSSSCAGPAVAAGAAPAVVWCWWSVLGSGGNRIGVAGEVRAVLVTCLRGNAAALSPAGSSSSRICPDAAATSSADAALCLAWCGTGGRSRALGGRERCLPMGPELSL